MNFIIWLVIGLVIGWVASMIMNTDAEKDIAVGIVGAMLGGWLISALAGAGIVSQADGRIGGLLVSLIGAIVVLAIVNLFRRRRVH